MDRSLDVAAVRGTLLASVSFLSLTPIIAYVLWVSEGCDPYLPFISDMDLSERAGVAFTVGYSISGLLLAVSGIQFGLLREDWFESRSSDEKLITINRLSMFFSVSAGIGLFWISFTPWDESFLLHIVLANVIFLGSISWAICITICTWVMSKEDERFESSVTMRTGFSAMGLFGLFGMAERFIRFNGLTLNFDALRGRLGERVGECISLGDSLLSQAAAFEWLFAGSMALVVASLIPEIEILTVSESEEA